MICEPIWQLTPSSDRFFSAARAFINRLRVGDVDAEFMRRGRWKCRRAWPRPRPDSRAAPREPSRGGARQRVDQRQFRLRFAIEVLTSRRQRLVDLAARFPDSRKNHRLRIAAGLQHAIQLAAGNDVEARAGLRQQLQDRQIALALTA